MPLDPLASKTIENNLLKRLERLEIEVNRLKARGIKVNALDDLSDDLGLQQSGEFRSGNGVEPGSGFTGGRFGYPGFTYGGVNYFFVGVENDVMMIGLEIATGRLTFGGGNGWLNNQGIKIKANTGNSEDGTKGIEFVNANGTVLFGIYTGDFGNAYSGEYSIKITDSSGREFIFNSAEESNTVARFQDLPDLSNLGAIGTTTISATDITANSLSLGDLGAIRGGMEAIADDAAISFTPKYSSGLIEVYSIYGTGQLYGRFAYNTATPACISLGTVGSATNAATGALSGTTGTDGKLTVSVHTDGKIYIENRHGAQRTIRWNLQANY